MEATTTDTKICRKCEKEKLLKDFSFDRSRPDGHHSQCKTCKNGPPGTSAARHVRRMPPRIPVSDSGLTAEQWAWLGAVRRLIDSHPDAFVKLLFSESVLHGVITEPTDTAFWRKWGKDSL